MPRAPRYVVLVDPWDPSGEQQQAAWAAGTFHNWELARAYADRVNAAVDRANDRIDAETREYTPFGRAIVVPLHRPLVAGALEHASGGLALSRPAEETARRRRCPRCRRLSGLVPLSQRTFCHWERRDPPLCDYTKWQAAGRPDVPIGEVP